MADRKNDGDRAHTRNSGAWTPALAPFFRGSVAVFAKDLRIEIATGEIVTTTTFFAVLVAILASVAFTTGAEATTRIAPGALWLAILFSSILALGRSWQREREEHALLGLLVSPVPRAAIWCGKAAGVFVFVSAVELIVVPLVALLFHVELPNVAAPLALIMVRTRARELLLASVVFPLLSPALLSSVAATREIFYAAASGTAVDIAEVGDWVLLLCVFDAVAIIGGIAMFGALVED
jgi:heme exporter protein B